MVFTIRFTLGLVLLLSARGQVPTSTAKQETLSTLPTAIHNTTESQYVNKDKEIEVIVEETTKNAPKTDANSTNPEFTTDRVENLISTTGYHFTTYKNDLDDSQQNEQTTKTPERMTKVQTTEKALKQTTFRTENGRSLGIDIEKYTSAEFHNQNNVYPMSLSPETTRYIKLGFDYKTTNKPSTYTSYDFDFELTTPKNDFFDEKYHEVQERVTQVLDDVDFEHKIETMSNDSNDTNSNYKKYKRLEANESQDKNKIHRNYVMESGVHMDFESVYNDTVDSNNVLVDPPKFVDQRPIDLENEESKKVHETEPVRMKENEKSYKPTTKKPIFLPIKASSNKEDVEMEKNKIGKKLTSLDIDIADEQVSRENVITAQKRGLSKAAKISLKDTDEISKHEFQNTTEISSIDLNHSTPVYYESTTMESSTIFANSTDDLIDADTSDTTTEWTTLKTTDSITSTDLSTVQTSSAAETETTSEETETISEGTETISEETETTSEETETIKVEQTTELEQATIETTSELNTQTTDDTKYYTVTDEKPLTLFEITEITTTESIRTDDKSNVTSDETTTRKSKFTSVQSNEILDSNGHDLKNKTSGTTVGDQNMTTNITTANEIENVINKENASVYENDISKQDEVRVNQESITKTNQIITEEPVNEINKDNVTNSHDGDDDIDDNDDEYSEMGIVKTNQNGNDQDVENDGEHDVSKTNKKFLDESKAVTTTDRLVVTVPVLDVEEDTETTTIGDNQGLTGGDNSGKIAAIVISTVGAVCLLLLAGLLIVMRKRQKRFNYGQQCRPVTLDAYSMDNVSIHNSARRKGVLMLSKRSYGNPAFDDPHSTSHSLNFTDLIKFSTNYEALKAEFQDIPQITTRTNELPEGCEVKNRYANVIPLPETRVFLKPIDGYPNSDYINANFVTGPKGTRGYYIACQAPMENTIEDFWRMIWEQQCKVILMLTHLYENGVEKCIDYLPPSEVLDCHRLFGDYQVTLKKREVKDKYIISSLQLKNMVSNSWREITHLWYLEWPEKGVPDEANSLIAFLIEARSYIKTDKTRDVINGNVGNGSTSDVNPVVVHCSPGTGRTGTVIACDIAIREFELTRHVDIPRIVSRIRRDRASSVQTKEQYAFIYKVINVYATTLTGGVFDSF